MIPLQDVSANADPTTTAIIFCRGSKALEAPAAGRITATPWLCARSRS